jgi:hypothetical protein
MGLDSRRTCRGAPRLKQAKNAGVGAGVAAAAAAPQSAMQGNGLPAELALAELTSLASSTLSDAVHEAPIFEPPARSAAPADVMPNTPSSPVWSLLDQQPEHQVAIRPTTASESVAPGPANAGASVSPSQVTSPSAQTSSEEQVATDNTPQETRRGWWQRRSKA